jgi:ribokinase
MVRIVVLGSSNTDMIVRLDRLPVSGETRLGGAFETSPGGKGANQAVAARRAGAEVMFLTAVGDDDLGRAALERYRSEGLDVRWARMISEVPSGVALIFVGEGGANMIGVAPGANAHLQVSDIDRLPTSLFGPAAVFLASLEVPLPTVVRGLERARAGGMLTVLNPAPVDRAILEPDVLRLIDVLTPNFEEARALVLAEGTPPALAGPRDPEAELSAALEAGRWLRGLGVPRVVITLGALGCLASTEDAEVLVSAPEVEAVDTVGAGDAFNGALAVALAEGRPLAGAAVLASAAGALAVTRHGAQAASPHRSAIDRLAATIHLPRLL